MCKIKPLLFVIGFCLVLIGCKNNANNENEANNKASSIVESNDDIYVEIQLEATKREKQKNKISWIDKIIEFSESVKEGIEKDQV